MVFIRINKLNGIAHWLVHVIQHGWEQYRVHSR